METACLKSRSIGDLLQVHGEENPRVQSFTDKPVFLVICVTDLCHVWLGGLIMETVWICGLPKYYVWFCINGFMVVYYGQERVRPQWSGWLWCFWGGNPAINALWGLLIFLWNPAKCNISVCSIFFWYDRTFQPIALWHVRVIFAAVE